MPASEPRSEPRASPPDPNRSAVLGRRLAAYRATLGVLPNPADRAAIGARIADIEAELAEQRR